MKRILIVGNNDVGLYNFRSELIQRLLSLEYEVHFTVPYGEKVELLTGLGAVYHRIDLNRRGTSFKEDFLLLKAYKKVMKEVKPCAVITYTIKPNIYASLMATALKIPHIATVTGLGTAMQGTGGKVMILRMLYKYGIRKCNFVFFQNQENERFFLENGIVSNAAIVRVPGSGVNTAYYDRSFHAAESRQDGTTFLYIARVMRDKGIEEYLEAASAVKKEHPQARFQILGYYDDADYQERVEQLAADGVIEYLGVSNDTRVQMAQADCIVLPSYHEGMSNVLLEGASFELPLITTDICGCKEAVEDGVTGFLCGVRDSQSLTEAMKRFLLLSEKQREEMGRLGREKMIREFERRLVVDRYMEAVGSLVK